MIICDETSKDNINPRVQGSPNGTPDRPAPSVSADPGVPMVSAPATEPPDEVEILPDDAATCMPTTHPASRELALLGTSGVPATTGQDVPVAEKLARLADESNRGHPACQVLALRGLELARHLGEILHKVKELLPHGDYRKWLDQNCPNLPERTASYYKWVFENFEEALRRTRRKGQLVADLAIDDDRTPTLGDHRPDHPHAPIAGQTCPSDPVGPGVEHRETGGAEAESPTPITHGEDVGEGSETASIAGRLVEKGEDNPVTEVEPVDGEEPPESVPKGVALLLMRCADLRAIVEHIRTACVGCDPSSVTSYRLKLMRASAMLRRVLQALRGDPDLDEEVADDYSDDWDDDEEESDPADLDAFLRHLGQIRDVQAETLVACLRDADTLAPLRVEVQIDRAIDHLRELKAGVHHDSEEDDESMVDDTIAG